MPNELSKYLEDLKNSVYDIIREFVPKEKFTFQYRQVHSISPLYKIGEIWYYDDESKGVYREPFVCGASELLDKVLEADGITNPTRLNFFECDEKSCQGGHYAKLVTRQGGGAIYYCEEFDHQFWLCSHLFDYFDAPPRIIGFYILEKKTKNR